MPENKRAKLIIGLGITNFRPTPPVFRLPGKDTLRSIKKLREKIWTNLLLQLHSPMKEWQKTVTNE